MLAFNNQLTILSNFYRKNVSIKIKNFKIHMDNRDDAQKAFDKKTKDLKSFYKFDKTYPGTAPPGTVEENFPLGELLNSKINNLNVREYSRDQQCGVIRGADESILDWLENKGKLKPRSFEDVKEELVEKTQTLLEDEFDFEDGEDALENFFGQPNSNLSDFV